RRLRGAPPTMARGGRAARGARAGGRGSRGTRRLLATAAGEGVENAGEPLAIARARGAPRLPRAPVRGCQGAPPAPTLGDRAAPLAGRAGERAAPRGSARAARGDGAVAPVQPERGPA